MDGPAQEPQGGGGPSRDKADRFLEAHARKAKPKAQGARRASARRDSGRSLTFQAEPQLL